MGKRINRAGKAVVAGCLTVLAVVLISCSSLNRPVVVPIEIPGAHYVGNSACKDCHAEIVQAFPESPHANWHADARRNNGMSGCESCHGAGSQHAQSPAKPGSILNPGKDAETCLSCHLEVRGEFHLPYRHPVTDGKMNCIQCHDPHGRNIMKPARSLAIASNDETCAQCHREQTRLKVFEHEAMREGCTTCHQPHASINPKLLVERDNNLCLRCHAQTQGPIVPPGRFLIGNVDHTGLVSRGTCWSAGCHSAVHGSNVDARMFY